MSAAEDLLEPRPEPVDFADEATEEEIETVIASGQVDEAVQGLIEKRLTLAQFDAEVWEAILALRAAREEEGPDFPMIGGPA